jgi:hypothetical protein
MNWESRKDAGRNTDADAPSMTGHVRLPSSLTTGVPSLSPPLRQFPKSRSISSTDPIQFTPAIGVPSRDRRTESPGITKPTPNRGRWFREKSLRSSTEMPSVKKSVRPRGKRRDGVGSVEMIRKKSSGIWSPEYAKNNHSTDSSLAMAMMDFFPKNEFMWDIGCGLGDYCTIFDYHGYEIIGVEGTPGIQEIGNFHTIYEADLTAPGNKFAPRNAICLEVGEHIERDREKDFLRNLSKMTAEKLVLSWAVPGQGGHGHVNELSNSQVIRKMHEFGFYLDLDETLRLRESATLWWFKRTLMAFKRVPRANRRHFPLKEWPEYTHPRSPHRVPNEGLSVNGFPLLQ